MKRLYLLRHDQSPSAYGMDDFDRPLSEEGASQAQGLGALMAEKSYQPDLIYCSPALRTRQTLERLLESLEPRDTQSPRSIYESTHDALLDLIQQTPTNIDAVLMVAHNPSIHQLAARLADERVSGFEKILTGYPPATLTVLDCDIEDWSTIQPGENALINLLDSTYLI